MKMTIILKRRITMSVVSFIASTACVGALAVLLSACATQKTDIFSSAPRELEDRFKELPDYSEIHKEPVRLVRRMPWEMWPLSRSLHGFPLRNLKMLQGDEFLKDGSPRKALNEYLAAREETLSVSETESLVIRISSTELALDLPERALGTLSRYFDHIGKTVNEVDVRFSLIFAYAYGRKGSFDQSFAWFSRINGISGGQGGMADAAEQGTSLLLRSVAPKAFDAIAQTWDADAFVNALVSKERLRRAGRAYQATD
ncbi:hypothetical protein OAO01_05885, partial [Oligoflexia bacterium]|nr:hypothetical protein [Oligoflexia bacterium]